MRRYEAFVDFEKLSYQLNLPGLEVEAWDNMDWYEVYYYNKFVLRFNSKGVIIKWNCSGKQALKLLCELYKNEALFIEVKPEEEKFDVKVTKSELQALRRLRKGNVKLIEVEDDNNK